MSWKTQGDTLRVRLGKAAGSSHFKMGVVFYGYLKLLGALGVLSEGTGDHHHVEKWLMGSAGWWPQLWPGWSDEKQRGSLAS